MFSVRQSSLWGRSSRPCIASRSVGNWCAIDPKAARVAHPFPRLALHRRAEAQRPDRRLRVGNTAEDGDPVDALADKAPRT